MLMQAGSPNIQEADTTQEHDCNFKTKASLVHLLAGDQSGMHSETLSCKT